MKTRAAKGLLEGVGGVEGTSRELLRASGAVCLKSRLSTSCEKSGSGWESPKNSAAYFTRSAEVNVKHAPSSTVLTPIVACRQLRSCFLAQHIERRAKACTTQCMQGPCKVHPFARDSTNSRQCKASAFGDAWHWEEGCVRDNFNKIPFCLATYGIMYWI